MTLSNKFCKIDYSRLFLVPVEPEIRIRHGDTYSCKLCNKNYAEADTITDQQKRAIMEDSDRQGMLGYEEAR